MKIVLEEEKNRKTADRQGNIIGNIISEEISDIERRYTHEKLL